MSLRLLYIIIILFIPGILMGMGSGETVFTFKPDIPDTIPGIQIQFEVRQIHVIYQGSPTSVFCLCANITNRNTDQQTIRIRYHCRGKEAVRYIEIGGRQHKIILVDKCVNTEESQVPVKEYFSQVMLDYNKGIRY